MSELTRNGTGSVVRAIMYTDLNKYVPCCLIITLANVDQLPKFFHQLTRKEILYTQFTNISTAPAKNCCTTL